MDDITHGPADDAAPVTGEAPEQEQANHASAVDPFSRDRDWAMGPGETGGTGGNGRDRAPRPSWVKPLVIVAIAVVAVAGATVGALAFALRGSSDSLTRLVPSDATAYATVYLDPGLGQKLALRDLIKKFPATSSTSKLNQRIDDFFEQAFSDSGMSFRSDIQPWLGSQLGGFIRFDGSKTSGALLIASKDDAKAASSMAKLKSSLEGQGDRFTTEQHGGVTITVGKPSDGGDTQDVYAIVGHTVVLASSQAVAEEVVDTTQGGHANISTSSEFSRVQDGLPKDKLALVFVDAAPLIKRFEAGVGPAAAAVPGALQSLEAYRGAGIALSAASNGIAMDVSVDMDPSKAQGGACPDTAGHQNTVLRFVPRTAYALIAGECLNGTLHKTIDSIIQQDPSAKDAISQYGLAGPNSIIDHLTGDFALTAGPPAGSVGFPGVALLAGTNDQSAMTRFLDGLATNLSGGPVGSSWQTTQYQGVTISYAPAAGDTLPISPAYAVTDGMAIVAGSPDEIKAIIDAKGGTNVTDSPNYRAAFAGGIPNPGGTMFVDIEAVAAAVRDQLSPDQRRSYDADLEPNLRPLKAFALSSSSQPDHQAVRIFVLIQ